MDFATMLQMEVKPLFENEYDRAQNFKNAQKHNTMKAIQRYKEEFIPLFEEHKYMTASKFNKITGKNIGKHLMRRMYNAGLIKIAQKGKEYVYEKV